MHSSEMDTPSGRTSRFQQKRTVRVHLVMDAVAALFERERALLSGCV